MFMRLNVELIKKNFHIRIIMMMMKNFASDTHEEADDELVADRNVKLSVT